MSELCLIPGGTDPWTAFAAGVLASALLSCTAALVCTVVHWRWQEKAPRLGIAKALRCFARSLVHEGVATVRTYEEAVCAFVVALYPLTPARRAVVLALSSGALTGGAAVLGAWPQQCFSYRSWEPYAMLALCLVAVHQLYNMCKHLQPLRWWQDPQVTGAHRLSSHSPLRFFASLDRAAAALSSSVAAAIDEAGAPGATKAASTYLDLGPWKTSLSGTWHFWYSEDGDVGLPIRYRPGGMQDEKEPGESSGLLQSSKTAAPSSPAGDRWSSIQVPGNWQLQGFGRPQYTNVRFPIWGPPCPPRTPAKSPMGLYRRTFTLPSHWVDRHQSLVPGRRVVLHIGAACSALEVWVNHQPVGKSKDSNLPSEFDITNLINAQDARSGTHEVAILVVQWSDATYLEDQDQWWLHGLHRDVELHCVPETRITDYRVCPSISQGLGSMSARITVVGDVDAGTSQGGLFLHVWAFPISPSSPEAVGLDLASMAVAHGSAKISSDASPAVTLEIPEPRLWSAEDPFLYGVCLALSTSASSTPRDATSVLHVEGCRVGLREVTISSQGILLLNGSRIELLGANRHEHDGTEGKALSHQSMLLDAQRMKQENMNAVRCSHYPNHPLWYDICDELGLYVVDEANLETHGAWPMGRFSMDPIFSHAILRRIQRMAQRDKNHSCIILWSLGNESGAGPNLVAARRWLKDFEAQAALLTNGSYSPRPVQYEGGGGLAEGGGVSRLTDVVCPMYASPEITKRLASEDGRPVILCEFAHAMGNSTGGLHKYVAHFRSEDLPRAQGGFIWDWVDQGLQLHDSKTGEVYWGYGGDFGDEPNDSTFCINGLHWPDDDRTGHPAVEEVKFLFRPVSFSATPMEGKSRRLCPDDTCCAQDKNPNRCRLTWITVRNWYSFTTLAPAGSLRMQWRLDSGDGTLMEGDLFEGLDECIPPSSSAQVPLIFNAAEVDNGLLRRLVKSLMAGTGDRTQQVQESPDRMAPLAWVDFQVSLSEPTSWAPAGHVLTREQVLLGLPLARQQELARSAVEDSAMLLRQLCSALVVLPIEALELQNPIPRPLAEPQSSPADEAQGLWMTVEDRGDVIVLSGQDPGRAGTPPDGADAATRVLISSRDGSLLEWTHQGRTILATDRSSARPTTMHCLWRASTCNDRGGLFELAAMGGGRDQAWLSTALATPFVDFFLHYFDRERGPRRASSFAFLWKQAGLHALAAQQERLSVSPISEERSDLAGPRKQGVRVVVDSRLVNPRGRRAARVRTVVEVWQGGEVHVEARYDVDSWVPELARVGLSLRLPPQWRKMQWLGLGPHENYPDRCRGAFFGVHKGNVFDDQMIPYIRPQDCGNHGLTSWMTLACDDGVKVQITSPSPFHMSALPFSTAELAAAKHTNELPRFSDPGAASAPEPDLAQTTRDPAVFLHLDGYMMGLGGDDSWSPRVHPEYLLDQHQARPRAPYSIAFKLKVAEDP